MMFDQQSFKDKKWEIVCPEMLLTSRGNRDEHQRWEGSGFVRITPDGGLEFQIISREPHNFVKSFERAAKGAAGTLTKDDEFFDLEAWEASGLLWTATRVSADDAGGARGTVWHGRLSEIQLEPFNLMKVPPFLSLTFYGAYDVPCNEVTRTQSTVGDHTLREGLARDRATHRMAGYVVRAESKEDELVLSFETDGAPSDLPGQLSERVEGTLEFLFGQPMRAAIVETVGAEGVVTRLRKGLPVPQGPYANPPVRVRKVSNSDSFWRLFEDFLRYIHDFEGPMRPPISRCLQYLLLNRIPLDAQALTYSVAVEAHPRCGVCEHRSARSCVLVGPRELPCLDRCSPSCE